jgi:3-hydroxymyristoyl/3-hydroxydecanoyl-(acyl carrier protein) dehydratase
MPGVLILEALAQVGAVCCLSDEKNKGKSPSLEASTRQNSDRK